MNQAGREREKIEKMEKIRRAKNGEIKTIESSECSECDVAKTTTGRRCKGRKKQSKKAWAMRRALRAGLSVQTWTHQVLCLEITVITVYSIQLV